MMYVSMIFMAVSMGYTVGCAPLVSCQYGRGDKQELASLTRKSLWIVAVGSVGMFLSTELLAAPLARLLRVTIPN
ncbi:hypothetical protein KWG61_11395 [Allobaculum sp. Allo2]|nr:hypothetical protein KWG61_11395 [Allobaculum sp. Allo2]